MKTNRIGRGSCQGFAAIVVAALLVGCTGYVKTRPPVCGPVPPVYSGVGGLDSAAGGPGGDMYADAGPGAGGFPGGLGSGEMGGPKTRFDGEPSLMLDTVYFDYDRSAIRGDQLTVLERNLAWIQQNRTTRVRIEGHCDERGTEEYNFALGDRRADSIREWLIQGGVDPGRIQTVTKGELEPAAPGAGESTWSLNRRAEFLIIE